MQTIKVKAIQNHCDPFNNTDGYPWGGVKISFSDVEMAIKENRIESKWGTENHIERIAYLVINKDSKPIDIDVGIPCLNFYIDWMIIDGNHRLAAAIYRGDEYILADIAGQVDYAEFLFGMA